MQNAYIGQRFPRNREAYFVIGYHAYDKNGELQTMYVQDEHSGQDAEFSSKAEARAAIRALLKPAKRIAH